MQELISCNIIGHSQKPVIAFCIQQNCQQSRRLCQECMLAHKYHHLVNIQGVIQSQSQNHQINNQNFKQNKGNFSICLYKVLNKSQDVVRFLDKLKVNYINWQLDLVAKAIRCFEREHQKNIESFSEQMACMTEQLSNKMNLCYQTIKTKIKQIEISLKELQFLKVQDFQEMLKKNLQYNNVFQRDLNQLELINLAKQNDWIPVNQWIQNGKNLIEMTSLQLNCQSQSHFGYQITIYRPISNISAINFLINLQKLELQHNKIVEIQNLENLINLRILNLNGNNIVEIKNLQMLVELRELFLDRNQIVRIQNLQNLTFLMILSLNFNQIAKIQNLQSQKNLTTLALRANKIEKIENLQVLKCLSTLTLAYNKISEIRNLQTLINLTTLTLSYNNINKIQNLDSLKFLTTLTINHNNITKIQNLQNLSSLSTLTLTDNKISKIQNIQNLTALTTLLLNNNMISNIENLQTLTSLQLFHLHDNPLNDTKQNSFQEQRLINRVQNCVIRNYE